MTPKDDLDFLPADMDDTTTPEAIRILNDTPVPLYLKRATLARWARRHKRAASAAELDRLTETQTTEAPNDLP